MIKKFLKYIRDDILFRTNNRFLLYPYHVKNRVFLHPDFISNNEFIHICNEWVKHLSHDYSCVIAIPRSGLVAGSIAACHLGVPLTIPEFFTERDWFSRQVNYKPNGNELRVLVVDDSIGAGTTLKKNLAWLKTINPKASFDVSAPFIQRKTTVKYVNPYIITNKNPMFEFALAHQNYYGELGTDFDGVLCEDPPEGIKKEDLASFYKEAKPYKLPAFPIKLICSGRSEKYRNITENWLAQHGVKYDTLILRQKGWSILDTKINGIASCPVNWYWESNAYQAQMIFLKTGVITLCFDEMRIHK